MSRSRAALKVAGDFNHEPSGSAGPWGATGPHGAHPATWTDAIMRAELRRAVSDVLAELEPHTPKLLTTDDLSEALQVSARTIYTLRGDGMPTIMIGDSPRFELAEVLAWLRTQGADQ